MVAFRPCVLILSFLLLLQDFQPGWCELERPSPNSLFEGSKVADFYDYCTTKSEMPCRLSSVDDFSRLEETQEYMRELTGFYRSGWRLYLLLGLQAFIMFLMIHLTAVGHFNWRSLPLIKLRFDQQYQDRTHGVTYQQYIWMRYLVLRGSHPAFKHQDFREVSWYKYKNKANDFDYEKVHIQHFTFLDKKTLATVAKNFAEADRDEKDKEVEDEAHRMNPLAF